jgi:hypothetical protein
MNFASIDLIAIGFGAFNILRLVSYLPQLVVIARRLQWRDRHIVLIVVDLGRSQRNDSSLCLD